MPLLTHSHARLTWPLCPGGAAPGLPGKGDRSLPGRGQQWIITSVGSWPGSRRGAVSLHQGRARPAALDKLHHHPQPPPWGSCAHTQVPTPHSEAALRSGLRSGAEVPGKVVQGPGSRGPELCASCPLGPQAPGLFLAMVPKDLSFLLPPPPP